MKKPKKISTICTGAVTLTLLIAMSTPHTEREPTPKPDIRPVWAYAQDDRVLPPVEPLPTPVSEKTAKVEPISTPPAEIDFEPQKPRDTTEILTAKESPRDNSTPEPSSATTPSRQLAVAPQMGDTRTVDGQPQVYLLGFGWIEDSNVPNVSIVVDGEGDINKMVGIM